MHTQLQLRTQGFPRTTSISILRGVASFVLLAINTLFWFSLILPTALVKLVFRWPGARRVLDRLANGFATGWVDGNRMWMSLTQTTQWDVQGLDQLSTQRWYMVVCNHQSWVDILVLQKIFNHRIPFLKFFLKQELIYVPIMGAAWWALEFPFMQRHSKEYLAKHPEQRGKDLETTRKACERFSTIPTTILNFIEGTRYTAAKHARQQSPYRHLLRPKAAGLALALQVLGDRFSSMLTVTIVYPDGTPTFWEFLSNRVRRIVVRVGLVEIPESLRNGDYEADRTYRQRFQAWLNDRWAEKDMQIEELLAAARNQQLR